MGIEEISERRDENLKWVLDIFRPADTQGVIELYCEVYGDKFPLKAIYDPNWHVQQVKNKDTCRIVARLPNGKLAGTVALFRSVSTNRDLYELGGMIVSNEYRSQNVARPMFNFILNDFADSYGIKSIWGEAVCNHLVTQQFAVKNGCNPCALEVDMMPEDAYQKLEKRRQNIKSRVSNVVLFKSFQAYSQNIYLPSLYEECLKKIYAPFKFGHIFHPVSEECCPETQDTFSIHEEYNDASFARIIVPRIGGDFVAWLAKTVSELRGKGACVSQFIIPLDTPLVEMATRELVKNGYWMGGLMPKWFGADGFMMQRTVHRPEFGKIKVYSKLSKDIFVMVKSDFEKVLNASSVAISRKQNLWNLLDYNSATRGDHPALIFPKKDISLSFAELRSESELFAKALMGLGLKKGEHVAILAPNRPEWFVVKYGCSAAGNPLVMLNSSFCSLELKSALLQTDITALFVAEKQGLDNDYIETLANLCPELLFHSPGEWRSEIFSKLRIVVGMDEKKLLGMLGWTDVIAAANRIRQVDFDARIAEIKENDTALILFTSGTAGEPKGAMLSHHNIISSNESVLRCTELSQLDKFCLPIPLFHAFGVCMTTIAACLGAPCIIYEQFDVDEIIHSLEITAATVFCGTPTIFIAAMCALEKLGNSTPLNKAVSAGANCFAETCNNLLEKTSIKVFYNMFVTTETLWVSVNSIVSPKKNSQIPVGKAIDCVEVKCINFAGSTLVSGEAGELCIRSPGVMNGYYKNPKATAKVIDSDGWYHSGDIAEIDSESVVNILGRIDEIIVCGGEKIFPRELEECLLSHPSVKEVQVVGIPSEYYYKEPVAFVILKGSEPVTQFELKKYCRERIAYYKIPVFIFFVQSFPKTVSGEIQKFKLKEQVIELINKKTKEGI